MEDIFEQLPDDMQKELKNHEKRDENIKKDTKMEDIKMDTNVEFIKKKVEPLTPEDRLKLEIEVRNNSPKEKKFQKQIRSLIDEIANDQPKDIYNPILTLQTLYSVFLNIINFPNQEKFRKLSKNNEVLKHRIFRVKNAISILKLCEFDEKISSLELKRSNVIIYRLQYVADYIKSKLPSKRVNETIKIVKNKEKIPKPKNITKIDIDVDLEMTPRERVFIQEVKQTIHKIIMEDEDDQTILNSISTLYNIFKNILDHSNEDKFRKLKISKLRERLKTKASIDLLKMVGFKQVGSFFEQPRGELSEKFLKHVLNELEEQVY